MVKYCEFEILSIHIIAQRNFLNKMVFFNYFFSVFLIFLILERRQFNFCRLKNFKN